VESNIGVTMKRGMWLSAFDFGAFRKKSGYLGMKTGLIASYFGYLLWINI